MRDWSAGNEVLESMIKNPRAYGTLTTIVALAEQLLKERRDVQAIIIQIKDAIAACDKEMPGLAKTILNQILDEL